MIIIFAQSWLRYLGDRRCHSLRGPLVRQPCFEPFGAFRPKRDSTELMLISLQFNRLFYANRVMIFSTVPPTSNPLLKFAREGILPPAPAAHDDSIYENNGKNVLQIKINKNICRLFKSHSLELY